MLSGFPQMFDINPYEQSSVSLNGVGFGMVGMDRYGDLYRYAKAGASNISKGKLQVAPAPKTNHHNVAWASGGALNTRKVTVTLGATAATADEYAGGYLVVNDATGEGTQYRILTHPAANSAATLEVTVDRPFETALVSGSEVTLVHNRWNAVVEAAVEERRPAGVPLVNITAGYYGWLKTKGDAAVLAGATITLGSTVHQHASTAGAVQESQQYLQATDASRLDFYWNIGRAAVAGVDTEYRPIALSID